MGERSRCQECGLDLDGIAPLDGIVALRSFARRYREVLRPVAESDEREDELLRRRPQPEAWSALEHLAHVVDVLVASSSWVRDLRARDRPVLPDVPATHLSAISAGGGSVDLALEHLSRAALDLAAELEKVQGDEWERRGRLPWGEGDLLDVMRHAVHEASHHLRDARRVLSRVRAEEA